MNISRLNFSSHRPIKHPFNWFNYLDRVFNLKKVYTGTDIWWVFGIAALLGVLFAVFIQPFWSSEPIEFGQALAGLVNYEKSSWGSIMFSDPSLQITIPALLLLAGFSTWSLSVAATAFFCATSFSAIATASFAFTRNMILSIFIPLLFLSHYFVNSHGYAVLYPVSSSQFGQTGMYFCLLAFALLACGRSVMAGVIGGLLAGVHAVWCVCFLVSAFPITCLLQYKELKHLSVSFVVTGLTALVFLYCGNSIMPPKSPYQPPPIPKSFIVSQTNAKSILTNENYIVTEQATTKRIRAASHNVLFRDAPSPLWAASTFFLPSFIFILLSLSFYYSQKSVNSFEKEKFLYAQRLLAMVAIPVVLIFFFKILEEIDPYFYSFNVFDSRLPQLVLRAIFNRLLNLTTLLIPIMTIGLLLNFVRDKKSSIAAAGLAALFVFMSFKNNWCIIPMQLDNNVWLLPKAYTSLIDKHDIKWVLQVFCLLFIFSYFITIAKKNYRATTNSGSAPFLILMIVLALIIPIKASYFLNTAYFNLSNKHRLTSHDAFEPIVEVAKKDKGPLLISSNVLGAFFPQLRTSRAMILPSILDIYDEATNSLIHVYCNSDPMLPLPNFFDNVRVCFEKRSAREWGIIGRETTATGMFTPDFWKLQIKPSVSSGGLSYYRLGNSKKI